MKILVNVLSYYLQKKIVDEISEIIYKAPLFNPLTPIWNKPLKISITNAGKWGWLSDKNGYKYVKYHPVTKKKWPPIPNTLLKIWDKFGSEFAPPNCSLINVYKNEKANLGIHQDKDENNFSFPVVSISLGNKAIFNYGSSKRNLKKICLSSGSVVVLKNESRLYYHSISKVYRDNKNIFYHSKNVSLPKEGRISVTLRRFEEK
tara:strand:- start:3892 stop:4503 length:612 start_codon:yes stop_codon:yes gene_type:complete